MEADQIKSTKNRKVIFVTTFIYLLILIIGYLNLTSIKDYIILYNYKAPLAVSELANQDTMTSYTKHLFYLNKPQILYTVSSFRSKCSETKNIIVLGCYSPGEKGIYLYKVSNPLISGVNQVTAAHEVLHAVYERLSSSDRLNLDNELNDFYKNHLNDPDVKAEIALYQKYEPNSVFDEMSCTFGTEIKNLTPALEEYYSKYFSNRTTIYNYYHSYQSQFDDRITEVYNLTNQLNSLNSEYNSDQTKLENTYQSISKQEAELLVLKSTNIDQYNSQIVSYNQQVDSYNSLRSTTITVLNQYNSDVDQRNTLVQELKNLDQAINTVLITS